MRFTYQNQYDPFFTEATRTFTSPQDWTAHGVGRLSLAFSADPNNTQQPLYIRVTDGAGKSATITHPSTFAVQSRFWRQWDIALSDDTIYIDDIRLCPLQ